MEAKRTASVHADLYARAAKVCLAEMLRPRVARAVAVTHSLDRHIPPPSQLRSEVSPRLYSRSAKIRRPRRDLL